MLLRKMLLILASVALLAACGPAATPPPTNTPDPTNTPLPTDTATPTPTDTPTPTLTPTPVPFDLTVTVQDADGNPLPWAMVIYPPSGRVEPVGVDDSGQRSWMDLSGDAATLTTLAQGFFPAGMEVMLERGLNEVTVTLERNPAGLHPNEVCGEGESARYVEDFEDGRAEDWFHGGSGGLPPTWSIETGPNETLMLYANTGPHDPTRFAEGLGGTRYRMEFDLVAESGGAPLVASGNQFMQAFGSGHFTVTRDGDSVTLLRDGSQMGGGPTEGDLHAFEVGDAVVWIDNVFICSLP